MTEENIINFIERNNWIEAKSYSKTAPHEYLVFDKLDSESQVDFINFVMLIREKGYPERFWKKIFFYYDINGYKYWTMGNPIEETIILNRVKI